MDKAFLWLMCSRDILKPHALSTPTLPTLGSWQRFRVFIQCDQITIEGKEVERQGGIYGYHLTVCYRKKKKIKTKKTNLWSVCIHNYLTNNQCGQNTVSGSTPDVHGRPHIYTCQSYIHEAVTCGLPSQPNNSLGVLFHILPIYKLWKGQAGTLGTNAVWVTLILTNRGAIEISTTVNLGRVYTTVELWCIKYGILNPAMSFAGPVTLGKLPEPLLPLLWGKENSISLRGLLTKV